MPWVFHEDLADERRRRLLIAACEAYIASELQSRGSDEDPFAFARLIASIGEGECARGGALFALNLAASARATMAEWTDDERARRLQPWYDLADEIESAK